MRCVQIEGLVLFLFGHGNLRNVFFVFFNFFRVVFFFRLKLNKAVRNLTRLPNEGVSNVLFGKGEATKTPTAETCGVPFERKSMMESTLPKTNSGNGCSDKQSPTFFCKYHKHKPKKDGFCLKFHYLEF